MRVQPLGREDPVEEGTAMYTHSSILVWRIPWTERSLVGHIVHRVEKRWTRLKWLSTHAQNLYQAILICPYLAKLLNSIYEGKVFALGMFCRYSRKWLYSGFCFEKQLIIIGREKSKEGHSVNLFFFFFDPWNWGKCSKDGFPDSKVTITDLIMEDKKGNMSVSGESGIALPSHSL